MTPKRVLVIGLTLTLLSSAAVAADEFDFGAWDTDDDNAVNLGEFQSGIAELDLFGDLDRDEDASINKDEFLAGPVIAQTEAAEEDEDADPSTARGSGRSAFWYWNEDYGSADDKDVDEAEGAQTGVADDSANAFDQADVDNNDALTREELASALYSMWDQNGDGRLDKDEFQKASGNES